MTKPAKARRISGFVEGGIGSSDVAEIAQAMIATPSSCSAAFCQIPCALPPRITHANRYRGATELLSALGTGLDPFELQRGDRDIDLPGNIAGGSGELEPLRGTS